MGLKGKGLILFSFFLSLYGLCSDISGGLDKTHGLNAYQLAYDPSHHESFLQFLEQNSLSWETFVPTEADEEVIEEILLEPHLLTTPLPSGWDLGADGQSLAGGAGDTLSPLEIPLLIQKGGIYRLTSVFQGYQDGTSSMKVEVFPILKRAAGNFLHQSIGTEIIDLTSITEKSVYHQLEPGEHLIRISPLKFSLFGQGSAKPRQIFSIYLTNFLLSPFRPNTLSRLRRWGSIDSTRPWYRSNLSSVGAGARELWRKSFVLPLEEGKSGTLAHREITQDFQEKVISDLTELGYCGLGPMNLDCPLPSAQDPSRMVYTNKNWNLIGDPIQVNHRRRFLEGLVSETSSSRSLYWPGSAFNSVSQIWEIKGDESLVAAPGANAETGAASTNLGILKNHPHRAWIKIRNLPGYSATFKASINCEARHPLASENFTSTVYTNSEGLSPLEIWLPIGETFTPGGHVPCQISLQTLSPLPGPKTARIIYKILVTDNLEFIPGKEEGECPAQSPENLIKDFESFGHLPKNPIALWWRETTKPSSANWYPHPGENVSDSEKVGETFIYPEKKIDVLSQGGHSSIILSARNLGPTEIRTIPNISRRAMSTGPRLGSVLHPEIQWKVLFSSPVAQSKEDNFENSWSPLIALNSKDWPIQPYQVSQMVLQIKGNSTGHFRYRLKLSLEGGQSLEIPIHIQVHPRPTNLFQPLHMGAYIGGGESWIDQEEYFKVFKEIGFNQIISLGSSILPKTWMTDYGMLQQIIQFPWHPNGDSSRTKTFSEIEQDAFELQDKNSLGLPKDCILEKCHGLGIEDFLVKVGDEINSTTSASALQYIQDLRSLVPDVKIMINFGEGASLATFSNFLGQVDHFQIFRGHVQGSLGERSAKHAIYSTVPWQIYSTPVYTDKKVSTLETLLNDYGRPSLLWSGLGVGASQNFSGVESFTLMKPFVNPWFTREEFLPDQGNFIYPSPYGPIWTLGAMAIQEGIQLSQLKAQLQQSPGFDETLEKFQKAMDSSSLIEVLEAF